VDGEEEGSPPSRSWLTDIRPGGQLSSLLLLLGGCRLLNSVDLIVAAMTGWSVM
jgi:hypothetical protein